MGEFGWFCPAEPTCYQAIKAAIKLLGAALQVLAESGGGAVVTAGDDRRGDRVVLKSGTGTWNEYNVTSHELAVRTPLITPTIFAKQRLFARTVWSP
jgi:hypothetical protein